MLAQHLVDFALHHGALPRNTLSADVALVVRESVVIAIMSNCTNTEVCVEGGGSATCVDGSINCQPGYRYNGVSCADIDECAEGTSQCAAICRTASSSRPATVSSPAA